MKKKYFSLIALVMLVLQTSAQKSVNVCTPKDWDAALSQDGRTVILNYNGNRRVKTVKVEKIHPFTVGFDKDNQPVKALFSPGNLQYNPKPEKGENNYRFAKFQWSTCFKQNTSVNVGANHSKWVDDDKGKPKWIDLFGWGQWIEQTDNSDVNPLKTSNEDENDYVPTVTNSVLKSLSPMGKEWHVPSNEEFNMALNNHIFARVEGVEGLVLLPDDWNSTFDANNWSKMEQLGAVFLPAAGCRKDTENEMEKYTIPPQKMKQYPGYWTTIIATIQGQRGWVILPSDWKSPDEDDRYPDLDYDYHTDWNFVNYSTTVWNKMVSLGAKFLPLSEIPIDEKNTNIFVNLIDDIQGYYWTSGALKACCANNIEFSSRSNVSSKTSRRGEGMSVRMIKTLDKVSVIPVPNEVAEHFSSADGYVFQNKTTKLWGFGFSIGCDYELKVEYEETEKEILQQTSFYNGEEFKPEITIKVDGVEIPKSEYSLVYPEDVINAGNKTVNITNISNNAGGVMKDFTLDYKILPKEITVAAEAKSKTYGENDPEFSFTIDGLIGSDKLSGTLSREEGENVGSYTIKQGTLTANDNYSIVFSSQNLTILPKEAPLVWSNTDLVYNGSEQAPTATLSGLIGKDVCTVTVSGAKINAGTYTATATALDNKNYKLPENNTTEFIIKKADPVIIPPEPISGLVFDNKPHDLITAGSTNGGKLMYKILNQEFSETLPQAVNAGDYIVEYYVEGNENFNSSKIYSLTAHIENSEIPVADEEKILCNADDFCNGKAKLSYLIVFGNAESYTLTFDNPEISTQKGQILASEGDFEFRLPNTLEPGKYSGSVVFTDNIGKDSKSYPFDFEVKNLFGIIKQLYYNTLCVDNKNNQFTSYQWTNNGSNLSGEVNQYLHLNNAFSGVYTVWTEFDGKRIESCPFEVKNTVSKKKSDVGINLYPNPMLEAQEFTIEVLNFDPNYKYEIFITNDSGRLVKKISNVQQINKLTLKKGNYTGILLTNGEKTAFKIIVK